MLKFTRILWWIAWKICAPFDYALWKALKPTNQGLPHYDWEVRNEQFSEEDLVWRVRLPIRPKLTNWEELYRIRRGALGNILETLKKDSTEWLNGEYLKEYYPNVWINTGQPICSIDNSNSRYHEGIAYGAKNKPRKVKASTMCVAHKSKANMSKVMHVAKGEIIQDRGIVC